MYLLYTLRIINILLTIFNAKVGDDKQVKHIDIQYLVVRLLREVCVSVALANGYVMQD